MAYTGTGPIVLGTGSHLTGSAITGASISGSTITGGTINGSDITVPSIKTGSSTPFTYQEGTWMPEIGWMLGDTRAAGLGIHNFVDLTHFGGCDIDFQEGFYTKSGSNVTVYFNVQYTLHPGVGQPGTFLGTPYLFASIGNLPFKCTKINGISAFTNSSEIHEASWPNGIIAGNVPPPDFNSYPYPYTVETRSEGDVDDLTYYLLGPVPSPTEIYPHTYDGYHFPITLTIESYITTLVDPFYDFLGKREGNLDNFWVAGASYTCSFNGSMEYISH